MSTYTDVWGTRTFTVGGGRCRHEMEWGVNSELLNLNYSCENDLLLFQYT